MGADGMAGGRVGHARVKWGMCVRGGGSLKGSCELWQWRIGRGPSFCPLVALLRVVSSGCARQLGSPRPAEPGLRQGRAGTQVCLRGRPHWPRNAAHPVRPGHEARRAVLRCLPRPAPTRALALHCGLSFHTVLPPNVYHTAELRTVNLFRPPDHHLPCGTCPFVICSEHCSINTTLICPSYSWRLV